MLRACGASWRGDRPFASRQQFAYHVSAYVRQADIAALEAVRQLGVIEAQQVKDGGVELVDVDFVLHGVEADVVTFGEGEARLGSSMVLVRPRAGLPGSL